MAIPSGLVVDTQFKLVNGVQVTTGHINDQQFSIECSRAEKLNDKLKLYQNLYRLSSTPVGSAKSISLIGPQYAFELNGMLCYALPAKCAVTLVEYAKQKSRLELAEIMPNFMDQTMKGLSIMHQSGWIHKGINPSTLCVNSPKNNPSIFVRITDQAAPLISRGNNVVPQLPRAPFLLYSTEWVQKTAVDPRLEDTWDAAALFYGVSRTIPTNQVAIAQAKAKIAELIGQINKLGYRSNEPRDRVSPMLSKFMGFFSSEYADNSSDRNKAPAILLGAEKVLPRMYFRDVQYIPRHPDFYFTPNLADLLMAAFLFHWTILPIRATLRR
ncbi:hypothetical protein BDF19DRAFT_314081 [Syncephalis fuscata]|nr:hypothetical protein BDF19DRAFT_314081 [Syncephalis fuscata]